MVTQYYFPFIQGDYIHAGRIGGNTFYNIEGIKSSDSKSSSFVFPNVRMARNEGNDTTFGANVELSIPKISILENGDELLGKLQEINQQHLGGISGNTGTTSPVFSCCVCELSCPSTRGTICSSSPSSPASDKLSIKSSKSSLIVYLSQSFSSCIFIYFNLFRFVSLFISINFAFYLYLFQSISRYIFIVAHESIRVFTRTIIL